MPDMDDKLLAAYETLKIEVGDIFEDCAYHPVLCLGVDYQDDDIWGISLIDGSYPRSCSLLHCGVRKLSLDEAWEIKMHGPSDEEDKARITDDKRWWSSLGQWNDYRGTILPLKLRGTESPEEAPDADPHA